MATTGPSPAVDAEMARTRAMSDAVSIQNMKVGQLESMKQAQQNQAQMILQTLSNGARGIKG